MNIEHRLLLRYMLLLFLILISPLVIFAQAKEKQTRWQVLEIGNFYIQIPEDFDVFALDNYSMGVPGTEIKVRRTAYRSINGASLLVDFYQGDVKKIRYVIGLPPMLKESTTVSVLGFEVAKSSQTVGKNYWQWQRYTGKDTLVDVRAVSFKQDDQVVRDFFGSVRLTDGKQAIAPNLPKDSNLSEANNLGVILETPVERLGDSEVVTSDLDRGIIFIFNAGLGTGTPFFSAGRNGQTNVPLGNPRLRVLYSSSGKVTDVNVIFAPTVQAGDLWAEQIRKTVFIPAMKGGKFVSVIGTWEMKTI